MPLKRTSYLLLVLFLLSSLLLACRPRQEQPATTAPATAPTTTTTEETEEAETTETVLGGPVTQQAQQTGPSAAPGAPATTPTEEGGPQPFVPGATPTAPAEIAAAPTDPTTPATEPAPAEPAATEPAATEPATEPAATEPAATEPAAEPAAEPAMQADEVVVTLDNVGATAWTVAAIEGAQAVAETGEENPTLNLMVGTRYTFVNQGSPTHPLDFRDAEGNLLLAQSGQGTLEADAGVAWQDDTGSVSFTLTPELAAVISSYHCTVHPGMQGAINVMQ